MRVIRPRVAVERIERDRAPEPALLKLPIPFAPPFGGRIGVMCFGQQAVQRERSFRCFLSRRTASSSQRITDPMSDNYMVAQLDQIDFDWVQCRDHAGVTFDGFDLSGCK